LFYPVFYFSAQIIPRKWYGVTLLGDSTVCATSSLPRTGVYEFRFDGIPTTSTQTYVYVYKGITPQPLVYSRFYIYIPASFIQPLNLILMQKGKYSGFTAMEAETGT